MTEHKRAPDPKSVLRTGAAEATERVQELLAAAERTARGILEDAEAEAQRRIDQAARNADQLLVESTRLVSEFADELLKQTETLRRRAEQLKKAARELTSDRVANTAPPDASANLGPPVAGVPRLPTEAEGTEAGSLVLRPAEPEEKPPPS